MTFNGAALLLLPRVLQRVMSARWREASHRLTHNCSPLNYGCTSVKDEDGFDSIKEEFRDTTKESENMRIGQDTAILVTHSSLKLIDPYARINGERFALRRL
jgi:hypothetical protein